MNKNLRNVLIACAFSVLAGAAVSCVDYSTDIQQLGDRVTKLEDAVAGLKAQIEKGAVITSVDPVAGGVVVKLSDGKTFTITNGADGKDGANGTNGTNGTNGKDGAPGSVVTIGANGNWFIDGKDTGIAAKGKDGKDGKDGVDGKDGANGKDGADGKDGVDGKDGANGKDGADGKDGVDGKDGANGKDGADGKDGKDGVDGKDGKDGSKVTVGENGNWFIDDEDTGIRCNYPNTVTAVLGEDYITFYIYKDGTSEPEVVTIPLAQETSVALASVSFIPEVIEQYCPYPLVEFVTIVDNSGKDLISNTLTVKYRLNPSNVDAEGIAWSVRTNAVKVRSAADAVEMVGEPTVEDGIVSMTLAKSGEFAYNTSNTGYMNLSNSRSLDLLQAVADVAEGSVASDYAALVNYKVSNTYINLVKKADIDKSAENATFNLACAGGKDLMDYVIGYVNKSRKNSANYIFGTLEELGLDVAYVFSIEEEDLATLDGSVLSAGNEALGKTATIHCTLMTDDSEDAKVIKDFVFYVYFIREMPEVVALDVNVEVDYAALESADYDEENFTFAAGFSEFIAAHPEIGLTAENWTSVYSTPAEYDAYVEGVTVNRDGDIALTFDARVAWGEGKITFTYKPNDDVKVLYPELTVNFSWNVVEDKHVWPELISEYLNADGMPVIKGQPIVGGFEFTSKLSEHFMKLNSDPAITFEIIGQNGKLYTDETADEDKAAILVGDVNTFEDATIKVDGSKIGAGMYFTIKLARVHTNGEYCETTYNVMCPAAFATTDCTASLNDAVSAASTNIAKQLVIKEIGRDKSEIYKNGQLVNSVAAYYSITGVDIELGEIEIAEEFSKCVTTSGTTITWLNEGTRLQKPVTIVVPVTITIGYVYKETIDCTVTVNPTK